MKTKNRIAGKSRKGFEILGMTQLAIYAAIILLLILMFIIGPKIKSLLG